MFPFCLFQFHKKPGNIECVSCTKMEYGNSSTKTKHDNIGLNNNDRNSSNFNAIRNPY